MRSAHTSPVGAPAHKSTRHSRVGVTPSPLLLLLRLLAEIVSAMHTSDADNGRVPTLSAASLSLAMAGSCRY